MSYSLSISSSPSLFIDKNHPHWGLSSIFLPSNPITNFGIPKHHRIRLYASVSERKLVGASWFPPETNPNKDDDFGGWAIVESEIKEDIKKGVSKFYLVGFGASVVILLSAIAHYSLSRKGLKFQFSSPMHTLERMLIKSDSKDCSQVASQVSASNASEPSSTVSNISAEHQYDELIEIRGSASAERIKRVVIPATVDSTQQEALLVLKKMKIVEDDVKADELCTKREYARWLVKANVVLERNPKHKISPLMLLSGSLVEAFDDVSIKDPDFWSIQSIAEAGLVRSKLSSRSSSFSDLDGPSREGRVNFSPESFISRFDLLNWKAQLDYLSMPEIDEKISRKKVGLMDLKAIGQDASAALLMDMMAGDNSVLRKVFGQTRRFQPQQPATKAQAAVTLTSGRMTKAINTFLSRMEVEDLSRKVVMEEIKSELLLREDIQRYWEMKINEVKLCALEAERHFQTAILDLKEEKNVQEKWQGECLKEKTALECQKQLLIRLTEEVNEMSDRLTAERANLAAEQKDVDSMSTNIQFKQDEIIEAKSILEAEIEALRILRTWVEEEAKRNQARAKVLEEVGRRWRWEPSIEEKGRVESTASDHNSG